MKTLQNRTYGHTVYSGMQKLKVINNLGDVMVVVDEIGQRSTIPYNRLRLPFSDHLCNGYEWISSKRNKLEQRIIKETGIWTLFCLYGIALWLVIIGVITCF